MVRGLIVVANNALSPQKLIDVARVVYNFEYPDLISTLVIAKPSGSAAQVGIPEVSKLAYKLGRSLIILPSINDAIELLKPSKVFLICRTDNSQPLEVTEIPDNSMLVVSCSDTGFTKTELSLGTHVFPKYFNSGVGPAAETALSLYIIALRGSKNLGS